MRETVEVVANPRSGRAAGRKSTGAVRWECRAQQLLVSTAELEPMAGQVVPRPNNDTILAPADRRSGRFLQVRTTRTRHHRAASGNRPTGQDYVLCKPWVSPAGCAPSPTAVEPGRGFPQVQMPRAEDDGTRWLAPGCIAGTLGAGEPRRLGAVDQTSPSFHLGSSHPAGDGPSLPPPAAQAPPRWRLGLDRPCSPNPRTAA